MDAIATLKEDVRQGRIDAHRLVDLMVTLQRQLHAANQRIAQLEKQHGGSPTAKLEEPFSVRAEEQRQQARRPKKRKKTRPGRRGRFRTCDKVAQAERTEAVYPEGVPPEACQQSHVRPVWRLENGRAVLVAYHIYRGPNNRYGQIPGVLGRSEFGLEIVTEIAYLVYLVGLSSTKFVCCSISSRTCGCGSRKPMPCSIGCRVLGNTSLTCSARCWPTPWWSMPTRPAGV